MRALLLVQVNQFRRLADAAQSNFPYARARAHQGDDAAVMVRVHFLIEQVNVRPVQKRPDDGLHLLDIASFTEVRNTFDDGLHAENLARRLSVVSRPLSVVSSPLSVVRCQLSVVRRPWSRRTAGHKVFPLSLGADRYSYLRLDTAGAQVGSIALSLGERAIDSVLPLVSSQRCGTRSALGEKAVSPTSVHGYLPDDILPTDNGQRTTDN